MIVMSGVVTNRLKIDPVKTAEENFFAAINGTSSNKPLTSEKVTYTAPVAWVSPTDPWFNTKVIVTGKPGFRLFGSVTCHYHRDHLDIFGLGLTYVYEDSLATMLSLIVDDLKLVASEVKFDVTTLPQPVPGQSDVTIQLQAKAGSLLYIGSVPIKLTGLIASNARLEEDGSVRLLEDGTVRLEDAA
jgi:hypothetical protein